MTSFKCTTVNDDHTGCPWLRHRLRHNDIFDNPSYVFAIIISLLQWFITLGYRLINNI